jgi:hypothetical protein
VPLQTTYRATLHGGVKAMSRQNSAYSSEGIHKVAPEVIDRRLSPFITTGIPMVP